MAWKKWGSFFSDIGHYFDSETWHPSHSKNFHPFYYFLTTYFNGYTANKDEIDLRALYILEGAQAAHQATLLNEAFRIVSMVKMKNADGVERNLYEEYKQYKTRDNLHRLATMMVSIESELGSDEETREALQHYFAVRALYDWLNEEKAARAAFERYKSDPKQHKSLLELIQQEHPQLAEMEAFKRERIIEKLLWDKINWEKQHSSRQFNPAYISPHTEYFSKCCANEMTRTRAQASSRVNLNLFTHHSATKQLTIKKLVQEPNLKNPPLPMPSFGNVIGWRIVYPPYLIDAAAFLFCEIPAKTICWLINNLFGSYHKSLPARFLKGLFAGPFILVKAITFVAAKLLSVSGIKEIAHAVAARADSSAVELVHISAPKESKDSLMTSTQLLDADPILPGQAMTSQAKIIKKLASDKELQVEDLTISPPATPENHNFNSETKKLPESVVEVQGENKFKM